MCISTACKPEISFKPVRWSFSSNAPLSNQRCPVVGCELLTAGLLLAVIAISIPIVVVGMGFMLRTITLRSRPLETSANVTLVSILPEDGFVERAVLGPLLEAAGSC